MIIAIIIIIHLAIALKVFDVFEAYFSAKRKYFKHIQCHTRKR